LREWENPNAMDLHREEKGMMTIVVALAGASVADGHGRFVAGFHD
jgi:hypothetical protein